jgi:energy-coupling factor transporter ATP-binding protein EcfA2
MSKRAKEIDSPSEFQREVETLIRLTYDAETIKRIMNNPRQYLISRDIADGSAQIGALVDAYIRSFPNYGIIRGIVENMLIRPTNRTDCFIFDVEKEITEVKDYSFLSELITDKNALLRNQKNIKVIYDPNLNMGPLKQDGQEVFNNYKAPKWKDDLRKGRVTLEPISELPPEYSKFFQHLCDGDTESINYVLDWIAISLQTRNLTFLCLIGSQGIGKGVLCKIISALHGQRNSGNVLFESISKQFNAFMADKTFLLLDEVSQISREQNNKLKKQNDDVMEIEQKNKNSQTDIKNFINVAIASNHLDALRIEANDRRLSLPTLTEARLETILSIPQMKALYENEENLTKFAHYLLQRKYNPDYISYSFKSKQFARILNASTFDWEKWFIDEFCKEYAGRTISCRSAIEYANTKFRKANITTAKLTDLCGRFTGIYELIKTSEYEEFIGDGSLADSKGDKRVHSITIKDLTKQKNYELIEKEH